MLLHSPASILRRRIQQPPLQPKKFPKPRDSAKKAATTRAGQYSAQHHSTPSSSDDTPPQRKRRDTPPGLLHPPNPGPQNPPQTDHAAPRVKDSDAPASRCAREVDFATAGLPGTIHARPRPSLLRPEGRGYTKWHFRLPVARRLQHLLDPVPDISAAETEHLDSRCVLFSLSWPMSLQAD